MYYNDNSDYARSSLCIYYNVTKNVYRPVKIKQYMYMFKDLTRQRIWVIEMVLLTPDSFIVLGYPETKKADQVFVVWFGQILVSFQDFNIIMNKNLTQFDTLWIIS